MIQELKIKNYLSFKDEVVFSFEATKDTTFEDYQVVEVAKNVRLLRFALVYGANASGKSNLLETFDYLISFIFTQPKDMNQSTGVIPFYLDKATPNEPSVFELKFYVNDVKYWYILELNDQSVLLEKMYYYTSIQPTMLFERRMEKNVSVIDYNPSVIKINNVSKDEIAVKCLPNMSFFAARDQVNVALPEIDVAKNWLRSNMMPVVLPDTKLFPYAEHYIKENPKIKKYLLDFLKKADFNITGIESKEKVQPLSDDFIKFLLSDPYVSKEEKDRLRKEKNFPSIKTDFKHSVLSNGHIQEYWLPQKQQSKGTQRVFGLETVIYEVLNKQGFLAVDEIEKSLHPEIVEFILQRFLSEKDNRSQLLITTHYDPLLNLTNDLFRKDSVWFTEKNETGTTDLFSLVDFKGLNRISSLQKAYRSGKFGALPNVKN